MKHSYVNPSESQDLAHLEAPDAGVADPGFYIDNDGWSQRLPISDTECILKCLYNNLGMSGMNKKQIERLIKEIQSESPPILDGEDILDIHKIKVV